VEAVGTGDAGAVNATRSQLENSRISDWGPAVNGSFRQSSPMLVHSMAVLTGRVMEVPLLNCTSLNEKENTNEHGYKG
jgi:hypothetical protein